MEKPRLRPPFREWATAKITSLRGEADALQRALDLYEKESLYTLTGGPLPGATSKTIALDVSTPRARGSKYEPIFQAFERAARVLTIDDMIEIAKGEGYELDRSNMRSQVFAQKRFGRAIPQGDGYVWRLQNKETAPSEEDGAVS